MVTQSGFGMNMAGTDNRCMCFTPSFICTVIYFKYGFSFFCHVKRKIKTYAQNIPIYSCWILVITLYLDGGCV